MSIIVKNKRFQWKDQVNNINNLKNDECMIKVHKYNKYPWAIVKKSEIKDLIKDNNNFFENINEKSYPVKVYFDIDGSNKCKLDDVKFVINKYFNNPKMAISGYESEIKNSFHIVLPELLVKDYDDLMMLKKLITKIKNEENEFFDPAPYSKNCIMKFVNQSKEGGQVQKIIEDDNIENHIITNFISTTAKPFEFEIDYGDNTIKLVELPKITPKMKLKFDETIKTITPEQYANALYNLNLIPCNDQLLNTWQYACYAKHNGISFNDFWTWAKQKKDTPERYNKHLKAWSSINPNPEKPYTLKWCKNKVSALFPDYQQYDDIMTRTFLKSFDIPSVKIPVLKMKTYETADIKTNHYQTDHKAVIFNIGMGGGKTGATVKYIKDTKKTFIWLSVRRTLARNTIQRFTDDKIDVYNYLADNTPNKKEAKINSAKSLLISTESLHYLQDTSKFDVLVIDEIESLLMVWNNSTHDLHRHENFDNFKALFNNCKKIILLDAFTTTKTTNFLKSLGINDIITYTCDYKMPERKVIENHDENDMKNKIVNDLNAGKKLYVFYPYVNKSKTHQTIEEFKNELKNRCNLTDDDIRCYHGQSDSKVKKDLDNVKETWKKARVILTNNTITVGVNYDGLDFYRIYLFATARCSSRDIIQTSLRIRCPSNNDINMYFFDKHNIEILELDKKYIKNEDPIYNSLIGDIKIERFADFIPSFRKLGSLSGFNTNGLTDKKFNNKKTTYDLKDPKTGEIVKCLMAYDDVDTITEQERIKLEVEKDWVDDSSMEEKLMIKKNYFDIKFKNITKKDRAFIWNNRLETNYKNIYHPIVRMLEEDNQCRITELKRGFKISDKTIKYMTSSFAVKTDYKNDSTMAIKIVDNLLGGFKSVKGEIKIDDELIRLYEISVNNTKDSELFIED